MVGKVQRGWSNQGEKEWEVRRLWKATAAKAPEGVEEADLEAKK